MPAHGPQQASRPTADFKRGPLAALYLRNSLQFQFEAVDDFGCGCEELGVLLVAPPECYIVTGIFTRTRIPVLAHSAADFRIGHLLTRVLIELSVQPFGDFRPGCVAIDDFFVAELLAVHL